MNREQALRAAKIEFGGEEQVKQQVRNGSSGAWLKTVLQDLQFSLRVLRRNLGFAALVIVTLGLGIGANTAIFSLVYGVLLRPLPYQNGSQIIVLHQVATQAHVANIPFSVKEMGDYREYSHTLDSVVEYHSMDFLLLGNDSAQRVQTGVVSANFFDVLGVTPLLGRTFIASDESPKADAVLVLSYKYWKSQLGGDVNIIGRVFQMNKRPHTVIGVLPSIPQYPAENDVYMPTSQCDEVYTPYAQSGHANYIVVRTAADPLRIKPEVLAALHGLDPQLAVDHVETLERLRHESVAPPRVTATLLGLFAAFAFAISTSGIAGVMALSVSQRTREWGFRMAIGQPKPSVVRMVVKRGLHLAFIGTAIGLAGSVILGRLLTAMLYETSPLDALTFGAISSVFVLVTALACYIPVRRVADIDPLAVLRQQ